MSTCVGPDIPKLIYVFLKKCCYHIYYIVFVGPVTTEATTTEATTVTTGMNFYSVLNTYLN